MAMLAACSKTIQVSQAQQQRDSSPRRPLAAAAAATTRQRQPAAAPWVGLAAAAAVLLGCPQAQALDSAAIFARSCAGCHAGGGNVIRRDVTLQLGDLQRYGVDSQEALFAVIYSGKNSMPGFGQDCAPRGACTFGPRLADEDIRGLAAYVLENALQGWPEPEAGQQ